MSNKSSHQHLPYFKREATDWTHFLGRNTNITLTYLRTVPTSNPDPYIWFVSSTICTAVVLWRCPFGSLLLRSTLVVATFIACLLTCCFLTFAASSSCFCFELLLLFFCFAGGLLLSSRRRATSASSSASSSVSIASFLLLQQQQQLMSCWYL